MSIINIIFIFLGLSFLVMAYTVFTAQTEEEYINEQNSKTKKGSDRQNKPPDHTP